MNILDAAQTLRVRLSLTIPGQWTEGDIPTGETPSPHEDSWGVAVYGGELI